MPLLNYTTTVPAAKTVAQIIELLAKHGARQVLTDHGAGGSVVGLSFSIEGPNGPMLYRLPVDVAAVEKVMRAYGSGVPPRLKTTAQAERVAWRILKDWIEAQLAIVATHMVTLDQVMLPYMLMGEGTVYDLYLNRQLALEAGT